ncbi:hypothetical protein BKA59DRAFT_507463 [Fusarium tricinctum]|uniref:Uncharacterized protein n=1 Tax=Fusarium tricinctum TaxID=61284 RepID=A0A8K0S716_9HYPO|nr:hypothetical protein BKA59DRAFT_507463 [Fusarium tricinctum]
MYRVNANLNANDAQNSLSDNKVQLRRGSTMILTPYAVAFTRAKLGYVVVGPGDKVDCKTEPFSSLVKYLESRDASSQVLRKADFSLTANSSPTSQSQEAYRYTLRFDPRVAAQVNIIKEFPGIENAIDKKAAPDFIQSIFDKLPLPMKTCLADLRESVARLHFIAGVAGSGKSYLMEILMLFAVFGNGLDNPHKLKILFVMINNVGIETFCKRLSQTFRN